MGYIKRKLIVKIYLKKNIIIIIILVFHEYRIQEFLPIQYLVPFSVWPQPTTLISWLSQTAPVVSLKIPPV